MIVLLGHVSALSVDFRTPMWFLPVVLSGLEKYVAPPNVTRLPWHNQDKNCGQRDSEAEKDGRDSQKGV